MRKRDGIVVALALTLAVAIAIVALAQTPAGVPQPGPENKKLGVFVGTWKDEAQMKPGPFGPGGKMNMTETCDWFTNGFSVVCHTDTTGFMGDIKTLTLLNYNAGEEIYTMYELNSFGYTTLSKATVDGDTWTLNSEQNMGGKIIKLRSTLKLPTADTAVMATDLSVDGGVWTPFMELKGRRVK
jgi:uncharacterized protein DUF1579